MVAIGNGIGLPFLKGGGGGGNVFDSDALAFISAHETQTGVSMETAQKTAINGFVIRLKGKETTNGSNIWNKLKANVNSVLFPYCPSSDSVASFDGYKIDLLDPANFGSFVNMVPADITVNGVIGGVGKYFDMTVAPIDFDIDNIGTDVYKRTTFSSGWPSPLQCGSHIGFDQNSVGFSVFLGFFNGYWRANNSSPVKTSSSFYTGGLCSHQITPTNRQAYKNGSRVYNAGVAGVDRSTNNFYGHASSGVGGLSFANDGVNELSGFCVRESLTDAEMQDYYEAWDYYQTNVITGGRNV